METLNLELLDCPICRDTVLDPIGLPCCGQTVCSTCPLKLDKCPCCRHTLGLEKGQPNLILREVVLKLKGQAWLDKERRERQERAKEARRIKHIERHYVKSDRYGVINDMLREMVVFKPNQLWLDLGEVLSNVQRFQDMLPSGSSAISREELLFHIDELTKRVAVRLGDRLLALKCQDRSVLTRRSLAELAQNVQQHLPVCIRALATRPLDLQQFLNLNKELLELEDATIGKSELSSFSNRLTDLDVGLPKKPAAAKKAAAKKAARPVSVSESEESGNESSDESASQSF